MATWGEYIRDIQESKLAPSPKPDPQAINQWKTYRAKLQNPEFDPVIQKFRSPEKENLTREQEKTQSRRSIARGKDRQLKFEQRFDILNNKPKYLEEEDSRTKTPTEKSKAKPQSSSSCRPLARNYDILSNQPIKDYRGSSRGSEDGPSAKPASSAQRSRSFDIISNKYAQNHEEKEKEELEKEKQLAEEKWWQAHDFDLLTGSYYDSQKDKEAAEREKKEKEKKKEKAEAQLPPSMKYCEGRAYDIVSYTPKERVALQVVNNKKYKPGKRLFGNEELEKNKLDREAEVRLQNQRRINRISIQRFQEPYKRPYDTISNRPYYGDGAPPVFAPHIGPPPSPFEKLKDAEKRYRKPSSALRPVRTASNPVRTSGSAASNRHARPSHRDSDSVKEGQDDPQLPASRRTASVASDGIGSTVSHATGGMARQSIRSSSQQSLRSE
eukprot:gb/GECG01010478.1/.p1 GENE.gb/GECG01010478.1/~~gb/GECG01010478.1/.p1  ORF type:complete len:440 (+),score=75.14 gb/GECG01010478.1/:1-1320(+)